MGNKKLILTVALLMVAIGVVTVGAQQPKGATVPPGPIVVSPNANAGKQKTVVPDAPALPAASAPIAFGDDFSADLGKWQTAGTDAATWGAREGRLQQWGDASGEPADVPASLAVKGVAVADGKVEAHVFPTGGSPVGLVFRGSESGYYRLDLYPNLPNKAPKAVLNKVTASGVEKIAETAASAWQGYAYNTWQLVTVDLSGANISASVDGRTILTAADGSYSTGWAGVWTFANTGAQFDNVRIQLAGSR